MCCATVWSIATSARTTSRRWTARKSPRISSAAFRTSAIASSFTRLRRKVSFQCEASLPAGRERRRVVDERVGREDPHAVDDFERALRGHMIAKTNWQEKGGVHDAAHGPAPGGTDIAQRARHTGRVPLFEANGMVHDVGAKACVRTAVAVAAAP